MASSYNIVASTYQSTLVAVQGVPVNVIQETLAHSDIKTTMKYIHMTEGSKRKALESLL